MSSPVTTSRDRLGIRVWKHKTSANPKGAREPSSGFLRHFSNLVDRQIQRKRPKEEGGEIREGADERTQLQSIASNDQQ